MAVAHITRTSIVTAARGWIGTPYRHQASCRGAGADCLGLVRGVWRDVIGPEPATLPPYTADWMETGQEEGLWKAALTHLRPVLGPMPEIMPGPMSEFTSAPLAPGQVLLFRMRDGAVAKHLGIASVATGTCRFIHAYSGHGVVESPLSAPWARRVVARFDFPGGDF